MLHRQRTLLHFLHLAGGEATPILLTKWAFLAKNEAGEAMGGSFYEFLPYKFGPYSFCLRQEMDALVTQNYVEQNEADPVKSWRLTALGKQQALSLQAPLAAAARLVMYRHGKKATNTLLDEVYERFLWFTVNSQRKQL